jgi:hypothetical protein
MDKAEAAAKSIIEHLIPGARMHYCGSQSLGEHDFDLEYPTGTRVPLEVTQSIDRVMKETCAAIRSQQGGPFVARGRCEHDWYVYPGRNAHISTIRKKVADYLATIEAEGRTKFFAFTDSAKSPPVRKILLELGIESGCIWKWKSPGIGIELPGDGGLVDPMLVNEAVETEALKADNRRKLNDVAGSEKHLFVYVDYARTVISEAVNGGAPPAAGPKLPPEITHAWVATWAGDGGWHTVWHAQRGSSWTHMGQVNIETDELKTV